MKRRTLDLLFSIGGLGLAVLLLVVGVVLTTNANFANDYVRDQLGAQHITFTSADKLSDEEKKSDCLREYAGQKMTTGKQAECYANEYIGLHLKNMAGGKTYADLGEPQSALREQVAQAEQSNAANLADLQKQLAEVTGAVNAAMVLLADHELATSTLAVRVAASTRADVYDAVLSGLGTSAGTLHSAASDLALELLGAAASDGAEVAMGDALRRWGTVPGFGHGAYPEGDPRAIRLLGIVATLGDERHRELVQQLVDTAAGRGLPPANIDFALAALGSAIGAPAGAMPTLFSIARVAGWVAHYLEELGERPLRFRARAIHATETS